ncbi:MAG TPA: pyridoxal-phosphate dependent enzyme, partial [Geobacteraceae bacterium]|nr:pyridoxal-phosphate dependent enzyme [Geobacteraceae bacterium]
MQQRFDIGSAIGNTPLVELCRINPNSRVRILAKLEGNNPGGSVKDRPAWYMLTGAEARGELSREKVILEPTSGNTGIAMAMIGAARGYRVKLVMPGCVSLERRRVLEAFGAELVLSPSEEATDGAIRLAHRILEESPDEYYMPNQYANPDNVRAHYEMTG